MKHVLGRKQRISNDLWIDTMKHIEEYISRDELDELTDKTIEDIKKATKGKTAAFAWSGGKDSLVLQKLCEEAGAPQCMLTITDLEYPAFLQWVTEHMPNELEVLNTGQDLDWLAKHQNMLFPQDSATAAKWFHYVQHRGQDRYYRDHKLDMILLGRRRADGNYVGKNSNIYTTAKGVTRYSPISDWGHEEVLAFIHYHEMDLPPFYGWKSGYYCGTHPWPARQWTGSIENGWQEVYDIDHSIVEQAADVIPGARKFLEGRDA